MRNVGKHLPYLNPPKDLPGEVTLWFLPFEPALPAAAGMSGYHERRHCWSNSTTTPLKWPVLKRSEVRQWFAAFRAWPGRGALPGGGRVALEILRTLMFDYLNWKTGRLDPSYIGIAIRAGYCRAAIAIGLKQLQQLGVISWARRCVKTYGKDGGFELHQTNNAYVLAPPSQWRGYKGPKAAPPPPPDTWGSAPPLPEPFDVLRDPNATPQMKIDAATTLAASRDPEDAYMGRLWLDHPALLKTYKPPDTT